MVHFPSVSTGRAHTLTWIPDDDDSDTYYHDHNIDEGKIQVGLEGTDCVSMLN
jgi:hypothetical protein